MARHVLVITNAHLKLADTQLGLTSAPDFACQVSSAAINAVPNTQTVPATFCAAESSVPGQTGWEMVVTWLQDWQIVPDDSLSAFTYEHDTEVMFFSLSITDTGPEVATGRVYLVAGSYGGDAGAPLVATATWPLLEKAAIAAGVTPAVFVAGTPNGLEDDDARPELYDDEAAVPA